MRTMAILLLLASAACGTPGRNVPADLPDAPRPVEAHLVAKEVGRLLSADPSVSRAAERRLMRLGDEGRAALLAHASRIPEERDPRWLHVLDENHALPPLPLEEELDFLLWKVSRPESFYVAKAQGRLLDLARVNPDRLLVRLDRGGRGVEAVAVALAMAGEMRAVEPLLERYRKGRTPHERRVAAEALGVLVGEERRPRPQGRPDEIQRDAQIIENWYHSLREVQ